MSERGQSVTDGRVANFSWIGHSAYDALCGFIEKRAEDRVLDPDLPAAELRTALAMYMGIAILLSREEHDGRHEGKLIRTREEIGRAGGLSATAVTRYADLLRQAGILEMELQPERGQNVYLWRLVEPHSNAPHHGGEAHEMDISGEDPPHHGGKAPHHGGDPPHHGGEATSNRRRKAKEVTPCSPPRGDDLPDRVFQFWRETMEKGPNVQFTRKRQRAIQRMQAAKFTEDEMRQAIIGCRSSDFHMRRGRHANRDGPIFDCLTLIFRAPEKFEEFASMAPPNSKALAKRDQKEIVPTPKASAVWLACQEKLERELPSATYDLWIKPIEAVGQRSQRLVLRSDNGVRIWVERRYLSLIRQVLRDLNSSSSEANPFTGAEFG